MRCAARISIALTATFALFAACQPKPSPGRAARMSPSSHDSRGAMGFLTNGVTAHRGNSAEFPENTLPAFQDAIAAGADWIECDIYRTRDGKLAVIHDPTTARVGDRSLDVAKSSYEELLAVDVATGFRRLKGKTLAECPPHRIPRLEEVLRLVMSQRRTRVSIQPKMPCVTEALETARRLSAEPWIGFNDGKLAYMSEVKRLAPEIPVFWDLVTLDAQRDIRTARECGFEAIVLNTNGATPQSISTIHGAGLSAGVWTANREADWARYLGLGIDRIYTDRPRDLIAFMAAREFRATDFEGTSTSHVQGICTDGLKSIYWSWTDALVKTDLRGHELGRVSVQRHHGDLCYHDGKVYVAVNLGRFNRPAGSADSWVYIYDAENLQELARHRTPEAVHGAGGIAYHNGRFVVVGGLPKDTPENYVYEYDEGFFFKKRHILDGGYTLMGIQTVAHAADGWWFGCYGEPRILLRADDAFRLTGKWEFDAAYGIAGLADGRILVGRDKAIKGIGHKCGISIARPESERGLVLLEGP
ncbi:MAG TPA: glycerophosphodiester phosphodiesterase family protein [Verrucomicrobiae bacterium]|nr:glycerophosphodiester phosphodiesterase family protein [Verrucomicrobiae bacterium]